VHSYFHKVLRACLELYRNVVRLPQLRVPFQIQSNPKFYPYFIDCIGALDGTHIIAKLDAEHAPAFRNRYGYFSQNVLGVCTFNLQFAYVLPGWEGSAHDSRVLSHALAHDFHIPEGKYYLADAGYGLRQGLLTPYRGVRYHLREQALAAQR
jgi:hypothetical protein